MKYCLILLLLAHLLCAAWASAKPSLKAYLAVLGAPWVVCGIVLYGCYSYWGVGSDRSQEVGNFLVLNAITLTFMLFIYSLFVLIYMSVLSWILRKRH